MDRQDAGTAGQVGDGEIGAVNHIRADVSKQQFQSAKGTFQVTLSLGVASYPEDAAAKDVVIARADESLYAAKHGGRNQTVCAAELDRNKSGLKPVRKSA